MAQSPTEIASDALAYLGQEVITDINDDSNDGARRAKQLYESTVKEVMRSHPWSCLIELSQPARNTTGPIFGYGYSYNLPPLCMRAVKVNGHESWESKRIWEVHKRMIVTNETTCDLKYVAYTTDTTKFDALLDEAIKTRLASKLAMAVARDESLMDKMLAIYVDVIKKAKLVDAQEGNPLNKPLYYESTFVTSRGVAPI